MRFQAVIAPARGELYDAFCALAKGALPEGTIVETCGSFADLCWGIGTAFESHEDFMASLEADPHFTAMRYPRWLAFGRVGGELRYYAGPIPPFSEAWHRAGGPETPGPSSEYHDVSELGRLASGTVDDAALLARLYLGGRNLADINVARLTYDEIFGLA